MLKEYVVTFLNLDTNRISCDCFMANTDSEAKRDFRDCYRHANYRILSAVETGREYTE